MDAVLVPSPGATAAWLGVACVVIFPTILGYLANLALARVPATTGGLCLRAALVAGVAAWWVLAERPDLRMGVAALALLVGVSLVARR